MNAFEQNKEILKYPEAKSIIKSYNKSSALLIEYEILYHRAWLRQVEAIVSGINSTVLIKSQDGNDYLVNFDPEILTLIRESECLKRLSLDVPTEAEDLVAREDNFKENYDRLNVNFTFFYLKLAKTPGFNIV